MPRTRLLPLAAALLGAALLAPTGARAADAKKADKAAAKASADKVGPNDPDWTVREYGHHDRPHEFDTSLALWPNSFGLAVWYDIPVLPDGFINGVNDSL